MLTIVAAVLTALSVGIGYYLTDRSCLRKIILFIGIIGIGLSLWQGYRSQERVTALQGKLATLQCVQTQMTTRHFSKSQQAHLVELLRPFKGTTINVWVFSGGRIVEKYQLAGSLISVFRAAGWMTPGITERRLPEVMPLYGAFVRYPIGASQDAKTAAGVLIAQLNSDCITSNAVNISTDFGQLGQVVVSSPTQQSIVGDMPMPHPNLSILIGDAF